ncbi:ATP-binding cassette domain-containing protein [Iocasia frigidifontis]|uniref:ATP-binding cassette domain-containing protein n=1 Tax=Iocasia fonsfrigidae TaxID=2682810 RepID=A0A8A7KC23_9FIRM|nr:ABC transporter ATP-binding protein [Iocasia fonsfrigidae]QTL97128.1 ATP-binding cassette domain-containing protein [Iocasia fonsfrigidae]
MKLELKDVVCGYGPNVIVKQASMGVAEGDVLCLLGPNGVGKTTLFKSILGFLKLLDGEILLGGKNIAGWSRKLFAREVAYVPQAHNTPFPFKVLDVILMGRTPYLRPFSAPGKEDRNLVKNIMASLDILALENKLYTEISGGEKQLVLIARALAQQAKILVMDEPTSNLDFGNQIKVLNQIRKLSRENLGIIMTTHFPDHVFICANKVAIIRDGFLHKIGNPETVVTRENLREVYGVNVSVENISFTSGYKAKVCVPEVV